MVMRHAGVCVPRQYAAFAGIVHGEKTRAFFRKLERRGHASAYRCRHNRGRIFHLHHSGLYRAIDESNSRYRRPVSAARTTERLMLLDALLADTVTTWLATRREIRTQFGPQLSQQAGAATADEQSRRMARGLCSDGLRMGIDATGRTVLLYLAVPGGREDFRTFLWRHAPL